MKWLRVWITPRHIQNNEEFEESIVHSWVRNHHINGKPAVLLVDTERVKIATNTQVTIAFIREDLLQKEVL